MANNIIEIKIKTSKTIWYYLFLFLVKINLITLLPYLSNKKLLTVTFNDGSFKHITFGEIKIEYLEK